nr:MAG TPA: hypothetical protein [Caudoviricetes sp.]
MTKRTHKRGASPAPLKQERKHKPIAFPVRK